MGTTWGEITVDRARESESRVMDSDDPRPRPRGRRRRTNVLSGVPLWAGRALQVVSVTMLLIAFSNVVLPAGVYWAASYFAVFGLSAQPFVFNAVLLFIVGGALKRRLRGAMVFLMFFELPTVLLPFVNLISVGEGGSAFLADGGTVDLMAAAVAAGIIVLLIVARNEFSARGEPASYLRALVVLVAGVGAAMVVGGVLSQRSADGSLSTSDSWLWSLHAATGIYPSEWLLDGSSDGLSTGVELVVTSLSASALVAALWLLLRSARRRRLLTEAEELGVRRILRTSRTDDSLAYFATRRDKSVAFSPDHRAAVSYRVVNGVALASGDPLGPEQEWNAATTEWLRVVHLYGWRPAVLAASERGADHYARHGMRGTVLGDEALLVLNSTKRDEVLRSPQVAAARRRARRAGYTVQIRRQREVAQDALEQIATLAAAWRGAESERGFSMTLSRSGDAGDDNSLIVTAHDREGDIAGLLVFVPWNGDGVSLDVMRRRPGAVNGVTEFLIASLVAEAESLGIRRVSLNFAMFREVLVRGARVGAGPLLRVKRRLLLMLSTRWQLDSLRRANEKYRPQWRPRYLMWSRHSPFSAVIFAVARAEGFAGPSSGDSASGEPRSRAFFEALEMDHARSRFGDVPVVPISPRAAAVRAMRDQGEEPYPTTVPRTHTLAELKRFASGHASIAGRIVARRRHGGITFIDLVEAHESFQVIASADKTARYRALTRASLGDIISVTGEIGCSMKGEKSLIAESWVYAAKSLRQPPNRHTGLKDPEMQVRQRHVHLASSAEATALLRTRSQAVRALRDRLLHEGYLEVETPILQRTHGGANARPFRTHINAYHRDLSLRIAPELALKKLIVAGLPQVFEIGRNFRNEGVDSTHNPEFTAMEAYRAFADYTDMRELAERLIKDMLSVVSGAPTIVASDGERIDVSAPWRVVSVCDALTDRVGVTFSAGMSAEALHDVCNAYGLRPAADDTAGVLIERLYEELIEPATMLPTFYTDFPSDTSPLARPHRTIEGLAERWDLVAFGMELGTAYSELVDPIEQRRRLTAQSVRAAGGDPEAMQLDEDFLAALEFGMPPTGGLGLGVDRIVMAATGATIRQTLAFPFVR
ncbi:Lysylphosphatidylglycerol biosynthesis bifunctional protein LysX [Microbacterium foliorum]|uniref:bifunctional lysylphosphatidylglycerol synthetase/lysine--tRNA ligase LysX n=2 Tax=Microbacterium foliorum TaxID=104336 RepID=UPI001D8FB3D4|nr:bifunctional lysylphosphatidylglycerol synthetase/lysine--tRNA ligase LysX [Microbacterium foliorum]CAH0141345.1 Lysylphosphatidylglycerol biosynthesis bifunctional protein LysX [Microbacterium foliorum]CAH0187568.1 Lysylphosphatidylglycerol biosynthesis bifunctional protein LysX [Microbacterium foliorum]